MEWELRIILGIIGLIIIGVVAFDAWRRVRNGKSKGLDLSGLPDEDFRDREGFDRDGIGEVRVIKKTPRETHSETSETIDNNRVDEPIIASRDDRLILEDQDSLSTENEEEEYSGDPELIFSLTLVNQEQPYKGAELLQQLIEKGCRFGEMDIFHRFKSAQNNKQKFFSVANAFKPGVFDLDTMNNENFAGISFFMGVPGAYEPETAYQTMVQTAREMKKELGGKLIDSSRSVFTEQTFQHELEKIKEYKRRKLTKVH